MKITALEIASRYVYPAVRRRLVELLYKDYHLNQINIASLLHITQSAVSRYLRKNRGTFIDISEIKAIDEDIKNLAKWIVDKKPSEYNIHLELVRLCLRLLGKGYFCEFHEKIDNEINISDCTTCLSLFRDI